MTDHSSNETAFVRAKKRERRRQKLAARRRLNKAQRKARVVRGGGIKKDRLTRGGGRLRREQRASQIAELYSGLRQAGVKSRPRMRMPRVAQTSSFGVRR